MIKILSGWTNKGGSTIAFINLTNALNSSGYETTFYGPHEWHLDKCKSDLLQNITYSPDDVIIAHFLRLPENLNVKKIILALHEKNLFEIGNNKKFWDMVVFLNEKHQAYHKLYTGPSVIIPNLKETFIRKDKTDVIKFAGIIGSFDENKQTQISIIRALKAGYEKIYLFGDPNTPYYKQIVEPLLSDRVILKGFVPDKQSMYDMIGCVYHSSKSEVACLVKDECYATDTLFFGNEATDPPVSTLSNSQILDLWINLL